MYFYINSTFPISYNLVEFFTIFLRCFSIHAPIKQGDYSFSFGEKEFFKNYVSDRAEFESILLFRRFTEEFALISL